MTIKLNTILLFALLVPFTMTYRISPGATPYWLFGLIFSGLFGYVLLDLSIFEISEKTRNLFKYILLWFLIVFSIGAAFYSAIIVRHQTSPVYGVHDIIIQQESAIRLLLHGKNPYSATYFDTPLTAWHYSDTEINPALYHFVMEPFYLLFSIPFYIVMAHGPPGFFDGRIPLLFLFITLLIMAFNLVKEPSKKLEFVILLAFNPATLGYFLEGRDDVFMFAFLFGSLALLYKNKNLLAGIFMALSFAVKQSAWPIFPFYFAYLYFKNKDIKKILFKLVPFVLTFGIIVLPFVIWDINAYFSSTIFYLSGNIPHSYPITGYGLGALLKEFNFIKDSNVYYPFWIWQAVIGAPFLIWLISWQRKDNTVKKLIIVYVLFLFVFWYFSRYFNNSHLGYISMVLITAYYWPHEKRSK